jgi:integrase
MPRPKLSERVVGPYPHNHGHGLKQPCFPACAGRKWRIIRFRPVGNGASTRIVETYGTKEEAIRVMNAAIRELSAEAQTIERCLAAWCHYLGDKGDAERTLEMADRAVRMMFPDPEETSIVALGKPDFCQAAYDKLRVAPARTKTGRLATSTHRQALVYVKMFARWCVDKTWLKESGFARVKGMGKRKKGAESKPQLTIDEAQTFLRVAMDFANTGDQGAVAAMMTLLMGLRTNEVTKRIVRDVDRGGTILRISDTKTAAGNRMAPIPPELQPYIAALIKGKARDASIWDYARNGAGRATGKVLEALRLAGNKTLTPTQIAAKTGVDNEVVYTVCLRLTRKGALDHPKHGHYRLRPEIVTSALAMRREPRDNAPGKVWVLKSVQRICRAAGVPVVSAQANRGFWASMRVLGGFEQLLAGAARDIGHADRGRTLVAHYSNPEAVAQAGQAAFDKVMAEAKAQAERVRQETVEQIAAQVEQRSREEQN